MVTCLQSLCDKVRDKVEEEERSIKEQQLAAEPSSTRQRTFPLIDADNNMVITTAEPSLCPEAPTFSSGAAPSLSKHHSQSSRTTQPKRGPRRSP